MSDTTPCAVPECERPAKTRGWCSMHYQRWQRSGSPAKAGPRKRVRSPDDATLAERFWVKIERREGHWFWRGAKDDSGYGVFRIEGRNDKAHRVSYELLVGPIPEGLQIDHLCRVTSCVNPAHLEPVTCRENHHRSPISNAAKTHCPLGHPYDRHYQGRRYCTKCQSRRWAAWSATQKAKRDAA